MVPITRARRPKAGRGLLATVVTGLLARRERPASGAAPMGAPPADGAPGDAHGAPASHTPARMAAVGAGRPRPARSGPALAWRDGRVAPKTGAFAPNAIANAALRPASVPDEADGWARLNEFALSYDGYAYWDGLPELAQRSLAVWTRDGTLPATVDERRACLFYEQRRWHHFGDAPAGRSLDYMWALAAAIRAELARAPAERATGTSSSPAAPGAAAAPASFLDDDAGFVAWLAAHPEGLVLNAERTPTPRYLKLHKAACPTLAAADGRTWTVSYRKVCSADRHSLEGWARREVGADPDPCRRCRP